MCDTLCVVGDGRTLFAKSSDRPVGEVQVVDALPPRAPGGTVRTQYLELPDAGACRVLGSRPTWLWGLEHGLNEHRVAIGNERLWTTDDLAGAPPGLIGMDLVRLGLERARSASEAVDVITALLELHGQGGPAESPDGEPYPSSFLVADPRGAWIVETSGRTWAARPLGPGQAAAISNRVTLTDDWTRGSADLPAGTSFGRFQDEQWSPVGDVRLACTRPALVDLDGPRDAAALMRHHGERAWGRPGGAPDDVSPVPDPQLGPAGEGITVCMHVRDYQATAASMVCDLPVDPDAPARAWTALGSPCSSVYVPLFPDVGVPPELADPATWARFDRLRLQAEASPGGLAAIRAVLGPLEATLWDQADEAASDPAARERFVSRSWPLVEAGLQALESAVDPGPGPGERA